MRKIFLSYRRADSLATTGRLYDALRREFGAERVFKDLDDIPLGEDFFRVIREALDSALALIVVIGPEWDGGEQNRLAEATDYVRQEVEAGLASPAHVIPLLVDGASMPEARRLPSSLHPLLALHAAHLEHASWDDGLVPLLSSLWDVHLRRRKADDDARVQSVSGRSAERRSLRSRRGTRTEGSGPAEQLTAFGPDFPFSHDRWISHPDGLAELPTSAHGTVVAVVGGGIAGLVCAYELMRLGLRPIVFEAGRLGGRLRSERFEAAPEVVADVGAAAFSASSSVVHHYIRLTGLRTAPHPDPLSPSANATLVDIGGVSYLTDGLDHLPPALIEVAEAWDETLSKEADLPALQDAMVRRDEADVHERWSRVLARWRGRTFSDFLAVSAEFGGLTTHHREMLPLVGFGAGGWEAAMGMAATHVLRTVLSELEADRSMLVGGAEQLARALWQSSPGSLVHWPEGTSLASLHHGVPRGEVSSIGRSRSGDFEIREASEMTEEVSAVVVTTQTLGISPALEVDGTLFGDRVWLALSRSSYAPASKTFRLADRSFWNDVNRETGRPSMGATVTDQSLGTSLLYDNGPDAPGLILLSSTSGAQSRRLTGQTAQARVETALSELQRMYPGVEIRQHFVGQPITLSWEHDPRFLGGWREVTPANEGYTGDLHDHFMQDRLPFEQRGIFLAGDFVSWIPGYAEGAARTALNAVWGVVHHLGGKTPGSNPGPGDVHPLARH